MTMTTKEMKSFDTFVDATVARMVGRYGYTEHAARYELATRVLPELATRLRPEGPPAFFRDGRDMAGNDV